MGLTPFTTAAPVSAPPVEQAWLRLVQAQVETALVGLLELPDERHFDGHWTKAREQVREYALRPGPRMRPALLLTGYCLARGSVVVPAGLWRFAAGLELLHAFLAMHEDVAERVALRRGGLAMHHALATGRVGEDLAVVVGDHLFALAMETMLGSGLPGAVQASQYALRLHRHGAAAQAAYLRLVELPLGEVGVLRALRVERSRMLREGLCSPLVCGAMLAGADEALRLRLARVGCGVGLAHHLREELVGLFGDVRGGACDFTQGRRTFPVVAAAARARPEARAALESLWSLPAEAKDDGVRARARQAVEEAGGWEATERLAVRASRAAVRELAALPNPQGLRDLLQALIGRLAPRKS